MKKMTTELSQGHRSKGQVRSTWGCSKWEAASGDHEEAIVKQIQERISENISLALEKEANLWRSCVWKKKLWSDNFFQKMHFSSRKTYTALRISLPSLSFSEKMDRIKRIARRDGAELGRAESPKQPQIGIWSPFVLSSRTLWSGRIASTEEPLLSRAQGDSSRHNCHLNVCSHLGDSPHLRDQDTGRCMLNVV